ncbi:hypothetical protein BGZ65_000927 [Modicella reniformis]|uniref:VWFA domain-containing protein n=1 Tax=Modicella reniformis TaxID=1440133 RepID=A0A9P6MIX5_9FUNG|nr:hypothetical protein BGZ65_000927 [Modicella reniformis]
MPRQDYSLPGIVPLPRLAPIRKAPPAQAQASQEDDLVMVDKTSQVHESDNDSDSDYDMLDDHCDILNNPHISAGGPAQSSASPSTNTTSADSTDITMASSASTSTSTADPQAPSPFVNMLLKDAESKTGTDTEDDANMTITENGAPTFASTGDARLDFFFEVLQGTDPETIRRLVRTSWVSYPLDTLRLIFQLRSILHGKGEREGFYVCLEFLRKEHPRTLIYNLRFVPDHGYWKDLLNWLVFEVRDDLTNHHLSSLPKVVSSRKSAPRTRGQSRSSTGRGSAPTRQTFKKAKPEGLQSEKSVHKPKSAEARERAIEAAEERNQQLSDKARALRLERENVQLERARAKFKDDGFYRTLHLEIARLFANALASDKVRLAQEKSISLAAKWCPSLNQFHDNHTLIASTIAQILYPEKRSEEDHVAYVNRVRQLLRQEYYVPLRKAIPVLEPMMSARRWDEIPYNRVPSFLESLAKGETTIASQALFPHELVSEARKYMDSKVDEDDLGVKTMEAQWKSYVERLAKSGTMKSAMAMCDVSGSMSGQPMEVAIALSLLLSQLSQAPFNRLVLTFSAAPQVHRIYEGSLISQVKSLQQMDWGMNTDLAKAFNHILTLAVQNKLAKEDMVKTLFIFSDMEFDQAVSGARQGGEMFTNYAVVKRQFESEGYELPQIVFWNLRGSNVGNKPAKANQPGVAMISGFSGMLMKLFLSGEDMVEALSPIKLMQRAIETKEFSRLRVID